MHFENLFLNKNVIYVVINNYVFFSHIASKHNIVDNFDYLSFQCLNFKIKRLSSVDSFMFNRINAIWTSKQKIYTHKSVYKEMFDESRVTREFCHISNDILKNYSGIIKDCVRDSNKKPNIKICVFDSYFIIFVIKHTFYFSNIYQSKKEHSEI